MEQNGTGCQASPESPVLCVNNCGFFGTASTMNMCSKCHKDMMLKQEQDKLVVSSIESIVNGSSSRSDVGVVPANVQTGPSELITTTVSTQAASGTPATENGERGNEGPKRCSSCTKRVGLTGFNCRCGNIYCAAHRYSDKHDCQFDYRAAARDAIGKANPVIKAEKLDKI